MHSIIYLYRARDRTGRAIFAIFFHDLRQAGVPVALREYLALTEAIEKGLTGRSARSLWWRSESPVIGRERRPGARRGQDWRGAFSSYEAFVRKEKSAFEGS
jgi:hypothetical protein